MPIIWSKPDVYPSLGRVVILSMLTSTIVSIICNSFYNEPKSERQLEKLKYEILLLRRKVDSTSSNYNNLVADQAALRLELHKVTSDDGVLSRIVTHITQLRSRSSEMLTLMQQIASPMEPQSGQGTPVAANGLTLSGVEQSAVTEQNYASPSRLMIVTPTAKPELRVNPARSPVAEKTKEENAPVSDHSSAKKASP